MVAEGGYCHIMDSMTDRAGLPDMGIHYKCYVLSMRLSGSYVRGRNVVQC